ncbi:MAG: hypothetical protein A2X12_08750 [Bacteroidetes bacterium GWE2_29_8]|nr:MAG: hypothetical protein A2X12_08750 [Bacteroidetes bacterium GWE2_29_8]OFY18356.1 MAG: hypothetical protein A2X02_08440 [Bacteroidetes bacterium GWF2_29_10]
MSKIKEKGESGIDVTIEKKLTALLKLQHIDSEIDKIQIIRGELPLEVQDLEDEIHGIETRLDKYKGELKELEKNISEKKAEIKNSNSLIKKYETQLTDVKNNREYDSLNKEVEYQNLEILLADKRIKEYNVSIEQKNAIIEDITKKHNELAKHFKQKKKELADIMEETEKDEKRLLEQSQENEKHVDDRLKYAYQRIRKNFKNGLAVVSIERDSCGGCFNRIPPQRKIEIAQRKKIIVCEYCGRILVDNDLADNVK